MSAHQAAGRVSYRLCLFALVLCCCERLPAGTAALVDLGSGLSAIREEYGLPALGAAVIRDGRLHAAGVVGVRKSGGDVRVEPNDPFHLGSCTKAMTASVLCILAEQGKLQWDTSLEECFPELKERMHPEYRRVTLVHLLSHRAGAPPMTAGFDPVDADQLREIQTLASPGAQRRRVIEIFLSRPPVCKLGEKELYSNAGYVLAGVIAEEVADEDYESLLRRLLFQPLGMRSAGFGAMGTGGRIDAPWQHRMEDGKAIPVGPGPRSDNPPFITPAGRVHCSIFDWAKYVQCVLAAVRGEDGLLPPAQMHPLKEPPFDGNYALGWGIHERAWAGGKAFSHAGSNGMNYSVVWIAPARNFAVLAATNRGGEDAPKALDTVCSRMIQRFLEDDHGQGD